MLKIHKLKRAGVGGFSRELRISSLYPHGVPEMSITPHPEHPISFLTSTAEGQIWHTHIHTDKTLIHVKLKNFKTKD